jgi:hypothetical protein
MDAGEHLGGGGCSLWPTSLGGLFPLSGKTTEKMAGAQVIAEAASHYFA